MRIQLFSLVHQRIYFIIVGNICQLIFYKEQVYLERYLWLLLSFFVENIFSYNRRRTAPQKTSVATLSDCYALYQLNVLYNTSSQFAGTLNTTKLYDIMVEAMEKTLSFDISSVLIFNPVGKPIFNLNTIHTPSENLVDALKIRSVLNYKTIFLNEKLPYIKEFDEIDVIQKTKQTRSNKVYGLESISYDSLFAPIKM